MTGNDIIGTGTDNTSTRIDGIDTVPMNILSHTRLLQIDFEVKMQFVCENCAWSMQL